MDNATQKERHFHHVAITVFLKPHDDGAQVRAGLSLLSPVAVDELLLIKRECDPERPRTYYHRMKDIELTVQETEIDEGKMVVYRLFFKKMHDVNVFAKKLVGTITPMERMAFQRDPGRLLDDDFHLSVRFDKTLLMAGRLALTEDGNCYQVKAAIAAYPRTEEGIVRAVQKLLSV